MKKQGIGLNNSYKAMAKFRDVSYHPLNLAVRFLMEVIALITTGIWGWQQGEGWLRFVFAFGIPILLAASWGIFAVPKDPSRSGKAPVPTSGPVRLILEICFFSFASWCLFDLRFNKAGTGFCILVAAHYLFSVSRIKWLLSVKKS